MPINLLQENIHEGFLILSFFLFFFLNLQLNLRTKWFILGVVGK